MLPHCDGLISLWNCKPALNSLLQKLLLVTGFYHRELTKTAVSGTEWAAAVKNVTLLALRGQCRGAKGRLQLAGLFRQ